MNKSMASKVFKALTISILLVFGSIYVYHFIRFEVMIYLEAKPGTQLSNIALESASFGRLELHPTEIVIGTAGGETHFVSGINFGQKIDSMSISIQLKNNQSLSCDSKVFNRYCGIFIKIGENGDIYCTPCKYVS